MPLQASDQSLTMPSLRKEMRTLASRALDGLKTEVKGHFRDLPPWEDYDPDILERYEQKLQDKERRQRQRAEIIDPDSPRHTSVTKLHSDRRHAKEHRHPEHTSSTTQYRDRRHAKEHQHRQRRRQMNEHYNRSSSARHKVEPERRHGTPHVVEPGHVAVHTEQSPRVTFSEVVRGSPYKLDAENSSRSDRATARPPTNSNYQIIEGELVPCHEHGNSRHSSSRMTAKDMTRDERPFIPPRRSSSRPKMKEQRVEPRHEHRDSHRVSGQPVQPKKGNDDADEFRPLIRNPISSPSSVYSDYSGDEQGTMMADQDLANQPATQETSMLSGQEQYLHQPFSQQEDEIWEDDLDDWKSEEEGEVLSANQRQDQLDQQEQIENWRSEVWEGNPEPCSNPSSVSEPRPQSTLERIGNIRLANMSTASVTTRFSEFC